MLFADFEMLMTDITVFTRRLVFFDSYLHKAFLNFLKLSTLSIPQYPTRACRSAPKDNELKMPAQLSSVGASGHVRL